MRSLLFVPGHNDRYIKSALKSEADALIFDLEDSVPKNEHAKAVMNLLDLKTDREVYVRIKTIYDIGYVNESCATGMILPKVETKEDIKLARALMNYKLNLIPLIETAQAILHLESIAEFQVEALAFGGEDFKADIQGEDTYMVRSMIVTAARAYGIEPIDSVYTGPPNNLAAVVYESNYMGFSGMLAVHPDQVETINEGFSPSKQEIAWAANVIEKYKGGITIIDGEFIGPPMVKTAKRILNDS